MPLQITGRHVEVTDRQKDYIEKKAVRLRKHFDRIDEMAFILAAEKLEQIVEINFRAGTIRVFTKGSDMEPLAAIDKAMDKLEAQIRKAKAKRAGNKKHIGRPHFQIEDAAVAEGD